MGGFNLMWLLSGVTRPPEAYTPFAEQAMWASQHGRLLLVTCSNKHITLLDACGLPLCSFARLVRRQSSATRLFLNEVTLALAQRRVQA